MKPKLHVGIIGCGLIGTKRAEIVAAHTQTQCVLVSDTDPSKAKSLAKKLKCGWSSEIKDVLNNAQIDVVVISTPNKWLVPLAKAALKQKKHVLIEKPMGRNLAEANELFQASQKSSRVLKIGFNHRYHPAIQLAKDRLASKALGKLLFIRAVYGHGGRPGYDKEWRANPNISGGGELLDQGVHLADLINWFFGMPSEINGKLSNFVWATQRVEDNAFALMSWKDGRVAEIHTSWTQWKNRFEFQIYGEKGAIEINGLGGSYGVETVTEYIRAKKGGAPRISQKQFPRKDVSWRDEWNDFIGAILQKKKHMGTSRDGVGAMRIIDAIYRSHRKRSVIRL
jgi:predicted dehydrogenase